MVKTRPGTAIARAGGTTACVGWDGRLSSPALADRVAINILSPQTILLIIALTTDPQRAERWQALEIEGIKLDHFDAQRGIVREVKKSPKREDAHVAQLKYYLYVLERNGIQVSHGLLEYPKLRETEEVYLTDADRAAIPGWEAQVEQIIAQEHCPPRIDKPMCKKCAYYEFCYSSSEEMIE